VGAAHAALTLRRRHGCVGLRTVHLDGDVCCRHTAARPQAAGTQFPVVGPVRGAHPVCRAADRGSCFIRIAALLKVALTRRPYPLGIHALGVRKTDPSAGSFTGDQEPRSGLVQGAVLGLLNSCSDPDASETTEGARAAEGGG
jgi:hypothetical protein